MNQLFKPFEEWTFEELVQHCQGKILLGIPVGRFNDEVWVAMDLALRWKASKNNKQTS